MRETVMDVFYKPTLIKTISLSKTSHLAKIDSIILR